MNTVRGKAGSVLAGLVVGALFGVGCSSGGGRPDVAAVVEGVKIASSDTEALADAYLNRLKTQPQAEDLPRDQITKLVLEYQIRLTFLEHVAETMAVSSEPESYFDAAADVMQPEAYGLIGQRREDFVRELRAGRLSKAIAKKLYPNASVSEEALREEYERRGPLLDRHWKATTRVARFSAEEPAQQVRQRVQQGEPFEGAASALGAEGVATVDINPVVAPLSRTVLDAVGELRAGEVSEAIPAGGGFLAVLVEHRQDVPKLSLEDLRPELTEVLAERQRRELFQEWFGKQLAKAKVAVDGHYGEWSARFTKVT